MSFVLDVSNGGPLSRCLRRQSPFGVNFGAYVSKLEYGGEVTRFFYLKLWSSGTLLRRILSLLMVKGFGWFILDGCLMLKIWDTLISGGYPLFWGEGTIVERL